jgi:GNAT superfamily N-acetyltransferase
MDLRFTRLASEEIEPAHEILRLCGLDMQERLGLSHWVPPYDLEAMRRSAVERQVYAVWQAEQIIATFTLGSEIPAFYVKSMPAIWQLWNTPELRALYVNRLAILPAYQGQGLGRWCMQTIERLGSERGCAAVRLDAYGKHAGLQTFYTKLGYRSVGHFFFYTKRYGDTETICYEKLLVNEVSTS